MLSNLPEFFFSNILSETRDLKIDVLCNMKIILIIKKLDLSKFDLF